jgi:hypothetical protein
MEFELKLVEFILHLIGTFFIWMCIGWNRTEESEIKIFSKDWWFIVITLIISFILLKTKL